MARILSLTKDVRNALIGMRKSTELAHMAAKTATDPKTCLGWARAAAAAADRAVERAIEAGKELDHS